MARDRLVALGVKATSYRKTSSGNDMAWLERASVCQRIRASPSRNVADHEVSAHREHKAQPRISDLRRLRLIMLEQSAETLMAADILRP